MFCKKCGSEISQGTNFCTKCGEKVVNQDAAADVVSQEAAPIIEEKTASAVVTQTQAPAVEKPVTKVQPAPTVPEKKGSKALRGFVSVLCCLMIFVFAFAAMSVATFRSSIKSDKIEKMVEDFDVRAVVENTDIKGLIGNTATGSEVEKIYRKSSIKDYLSDTLNEYAEYILGGKTPSGVSEDDVISLMEENAYIIEDISGYELTMYDYKTISEFFEEDGEKTLGVFSSEVRTNGVLDAVRIVCSVVVIIALAVLAVLFFLLMFKARKWRIDTLTWGGITVIIAAVIFTVLLSIQQIIIGLLPDNLIVEELVGLYLGNILMPVLKTGGIAAGIGLVMILVNLIINKCKEMKKSA